MYVNQYTHIYIYIYIDMWLVLINGQDVYVCIHISIYMVSDG